MSATISEPSQSGLQTPPTGWQKFRMVLKVVELRVRFLALMAATGLVFGYWDTIRVSYEKWMRPSAPGSAASALPATEHFCPMHPKVVRDDPGSCPICGMPLSKRTRGETPTLPAGVTARVELSPDRIQQAGVQTVDVSYQPIEETLTTVGQVTYDERRLARIASKTKGLARLDTLHVNFTGTRVEAGQPLAEVYSPELYQAVRELLIAKRNTAQPARSELGRSLQAGGADLAQLAREKLQLWGLTADQITRIEADGRAEARLPILAPISGVVVRKNVVQGQYVSEGEAMFEIADLDRVWVQARVFEDQVGKVREGQAVEATVTAFPGEVFRGKVAFVDPTLDPATRTVGVRYDLANPEGRLRPGMFANVTLRMPVAESLATSSPSASKTALHKASLTAADQKLCLVTGQHLGSMGEPRAVLVEGQNIWICCDACETSLVDEPKKYLTKLASLRSERPLTPEQQRICPVTRADLGSMGAPVSVDLGSRTVWVCCQGCVEPLKAAPSRYLAALQAPPENGVLAVPESAVIDTGSRKIVYIETAPGVFEGREVVLGARSGSVYPVLSGLTPGDRVAASGAFLIDAESRLNPGSATPAEAPSRPQPVESVPTAATALRSDGTRP